MKPFIVLFSLIMIISVVISGALLLSRRKGKGRWRDREHIQPSLFNFFTTLYAFFIGFAIVTLWSVFLTAKTNITREADSLMIVYRTAKHLPGSEPFRQALANYVKTVIDVEWGEMGKGAMSPEASQRFDDIWSRFYELVSDPNKSGELYINITEAGRQRSSRASALQGNLYPPVWMILMFGLVSVIFGLYFINREPTLVSLIYEFMVIFMVLACIYFIFDLDTPFSGLITVKPEAFRTVYLKMLSLP
ncbi:MAG: hypothetical protein COS90_09575 [Deltaproteobacteria bacterium CG07_land_8_20_14_0_80_60_11]|nr:MAG: hypothetical protein COS90_09575 [Deltaproteobacteria bacterium CG07_land_8_20_14_0_80_60_11]